MTTRGVILGFDWAFLDSTIRSRDTRHPRKASSGNLANFALFTVQSCAVYMEMYRNSVMVLLHHKTLQPASHCCLYKFTPKHSPIKTKPWPHKTNWWTIKIFWAISNKFLSCWNLDIAVVDLEIYITMRKLWLLNIIFQTERLLIEKIKSHNLWFWNFGKSLASS
mgnify:CR=1 FL=1